MATQATISSSVLQGLRLDLSRLDIDAAELARRCHLPQVNSLAQDVDIPLQSFVSALEFVAETGHCRAFGWQAGKYYEISYLGDLGRTISCAPTLGAALQVFARYLRMIQSTSELTFDVEGNQLVMNYRILDPDIWPRCQDAEFTLSFLCSLMRRCLGDDWRPLYVGFEHKPISDPGARNDELGITCEYGCDANTIVLPTSALDAPMPPGGQIEWPAAFARLNEAACRRDRARPVHSRVKSALLSELGRSTPCQAMVAKKLGLSSRTLHRRLKTEGTSYSAILHDCRSRLGRFLLLNGDRPLSQIAHDLGYSDYSAFSRAFRADFGKTPKAFRDSSDWPAPI